MAAKKKTKARTYQGMTYRDVQRHNSVHRSQLPRTEQKQLKQVGCRNVGWPKVIQLYEKIQEIEERLSDKLPSLEELFLDADRMGSKYQTAEERSEFQKKMAAVSAEMSELIDQQFPDTDAEVICFQPARKASRKRTKGRSQS